MASECPIPGDGYPNYPYSFSPWNVCTQQMTPLRDAANVTYGHMYAFRDYMNTLYVTVALDGAENGQWFLVPTQPSSECI